MVVSGRLLRFQWLPCRYDKVMLGRECDTGKDVSVKIKEGTISRSLVLSSVESPHLHLRGDSQKCQHASGTDFSFALTPLPFRSLLSLSDSRLIQFITNHASRLHPRIFHNYRSCTPNLRPSLDLRCSSSAQATNQPHLPS